MQDKQRRAMFAKMKGGSTNKYAVVQVRTRYSAPGQKPAEFGRYSTKKEALKARDRAEELIGGSETMPLVVKKVPMSLISKKEYTTDPKEMPAAYNGKAPYKGYITDAELNRRTEAHENKKRLGYSSNTKDAFKRMAEEDVGNQKMIPYAYRKKYGQGFGIMFHGKLLHNKGKPIKFTTEAGAKRYASKEKGQTVVPIGPTTNERLTR